MMAAVEHHQIAVKSGHKIGKSLLVAILAIWWAVCWPDGKVLITAPTQDQIKDIVWAEIRKLATRARRLGVIDIPEAAKDPSTGIRWADGRCIIGRSTDKAERIQGYSGPACLYLIDEASGVAREIFEALQGNTAGGSDDDDSAVAKFVMTGNPTQVSGEFYDAFNRNRSQWRRFTVSSAETPNAKTGKVIIRGLATKDYVDRKRKAWGADSDLFRVRVEGKFPRLGGDVVIPIHLIEEAAARWVETPNEGRLHLGVDVARFGDDDSVVAPRRGRKLGYLRSCSGFDTVEVAGMALATIRELHKPGEELPLVKVDTIGVGAGVADYLRHYRNERDEPVCEVVDVQVSESSDEPEKYPNKRSQLWFEVKEWLAQNGALPDDESGDDTAVADLFGELSAKFTFDCKGRQVVERKKDFKRRLGRSPDRADAVALAIHDPGTAGIEAESGDPNGYRWGPSPARGFG